MMMRGRLRRSHIVGVAVRRSVGIHRLSIGLRVLLTTISIWMAPLTASRWRHVRDYLHATRDYSSRTAATSCVGRGCRTAKAFCQLLNKCTANIESSNVDRISNAQNNEGALSREWKGRVRGIQTRARLLLDLTDPGTFLADYRTNQNVRDQ